MANKYRDRTNGALETQKELRRKWRMCERKRRYETMQEAARDGAVIYFCPYCKGFHRSQSLMNLAAKQRKRKESRRGAPR